MPTKAKKPTETATLPNKQSAVFVFGTIGDTTWRLFVPSVGGTLLGVWADNSYGSKPWLTLTGVVVGSALAILLVRQQLKAGDKGAQS